MNLESLQAAIKRVLLEREYPGLPPIGLMRRYAIEAAHGVPISAEQAFARVREAISRFGIYEPAAAAEHCGSEIWQAVQGIGGWNRICDSPPDQRQTLFAHFRDGWHRSQDSRQQNLRLSEDVQPQERIPYNGPTPQAPVRLLADSFAVESA